MIRINLLREQTARVRHAAIKPEVSRLGLVAGALVVVVVGGLGAWYHMVNREIAQLTARRDALRIESAKLEAEKKQIAEYEKLKQLRQHRIEVIEKLKDNQMGPVELLNHVIRAIPADGLLWLTVLEQKGDRVQMRGYAGRSESIPDLLVQLSSSGYFKAVDLESIEAESEASRFSLVCTTARKPPTE